MLSTLSSCSDLVKSNNLVLFQVSTYHVVILVCMITNYSYLQKLATFGNHTEQMYHPICLHRALDASPISLMLAFIQNAVCMSTKTMLLKFL